MRRKLNQRMGNINRNEMIQFCFFSLPIRKVDQEVIAPLDSETKFRIREFLR